MILPTVQFKYADTTLLVISAAVYGAAGAALWLWLGPVAVVPLATLLLAGVFALLLHQFRVRERQDVHQLRQIQALLTLYSLIPFKSTPPWFTGWAATPEFAVTLYKLVRQRKPNLVLELGSGASSLVMAAALAQNDVGRLVSLDQDKEYAARTRVALSQEGLDGVAQVIHAPIGKTTIDGHPWLWYDRASVPSEGPIDLLVIDGPNRELQKMARFPALPILFERLSPDAVVVLDDAHRKDERKAVERWLELDDRLEVELLDSPKGTAIISRRRS